MNDIDIENIKKELRKRSAAEYNFKAGGDLTQDNLATATTEELKQMVNEHSNNKKVMSGEKIKKIVDNIFKKYADDTDNMVVLGACNYYDEDRHVSFVEEPLKEIDFDGEQVTIASVAQNSKLAREALKHELSVYEFASNIPGTIGGAIVMNAGAYGSEIKDRLIEVTYLDLDKNELVTLQNGECKFAYRNSVFKDMNVVIVEAKFKLEKSSAEDIKATMNEYTKKRIETQPIDRPNAGSTFKRGDGFITAQLIDEAGLKGYSIGGAEVSTKHAGFIINNGQATAQDVLDLVEHVKKTIKEKFDKDIELEVKVIGE